MNKELITYFKKLNEIQRKINQQIEILNQNPDFVDLCIQQKQFEMEKQTFKDCWEYGGKQMFKPCKSDYVKVQVIKSNKVDIIKLKEEHPSVYNACLEEGKPFIRVTQINRK